MVKMKAQEIANYLNKVLEINSIEDNSKNGLQVENIQDIKKVGFAVDASLETYQKAYQAGCQMLIVHHGMIWNGLESISGFIFKQLKYLFEKDIALYGVHLPLDKHNLYGNNIQLANLLNLKDVQEFDTIGFEGKTDKTLTEIKQILKENGITDLCLNFGPENIGKVAIVSGGGDHSVFKALNYDLFITGEGAHHLHHIAKENNLNIIFGGHYQTEVWGVKALMKLVNEKFNLETEFIDVPTLI
jgi:dinuclear metal center YbgI/SA1388 family protein